MTIPNGTRLGPYEILAPLGAGGMGEVYRARDTRLDRSVAVKILPATLASNADLRTRFQREAKTISQLNHPNICTLHDVGENFLVMELLEGETLADRIARGPLPIEQVLRLGAEIARAIDGAHRHGVMHRDLKPGNVMITRSGAKVLDFGLAKSTGEVSIDRNAETVQRELTAEGTIVGTFQYMAPEQLEGAAVDHRTDIFALGAVLYEMATGRRAFDGKTKTSLIAAIVAAEPKPIHELQPLTPPSFERLVAKCLAKDPDERWQSASDVAAELTWIGETFAREKAAPQKRSTLPWMIASALLAIIAIAAVAAMAMRRAQEPSVVLSLTMPPHLFEFYSQAALSPDGNMVAFVGYRKNLRALWVRALDQREPRMLMGTEGGTMPFWSPDGKALAFFAGGRLKRVFVAGGPPQLICDAPVPFGGTWAGDTILFSGRFDDPILRVDASGGTPKPVTKVGKGEEAHRWPSFLPDGDHFLFLGDAPRTEDHHLHLGSLKGGASVILTQAVSNARYANGNVFYVRGGSLIAQKLDVGAGKLTGEPRVVAESVAEVWQNHLFEFSVTENGRAVYRSVDPREQLTWIDRAGKTAGTIGEPRRYGAVRIAPDQRRVAFAALDADGRGDDIWLLDVARGVTTRFTFDPASDGGPVWSPDSTRVAFSSMRAAYGETFTAPVANPSAVQRLTTTTEGTVWPSAWSPDGKSLLIERGDRTNTDLVLYSLENGSMKPYAASSFEEHSAAFSPDGSMLAFVSEESGHAEVYVEKFPSRAERRQISTGGGNQPRWRGDGKELFFVADIELRSIDLTDDNAVPQPLFSGILGPYDVSADGQRFLVAKSVEDITTIPLTFVSGAMQK